MLKLTLLVLVFSLYGCTSRTNSNTPNLSLVENKTNQGYAKKEIFSDALLNLSVGEQIQINDKEYVQTKEYTSALGDVCKNLSASNSDQITLCRLGDSWIYLSPLSNFKINNSVN